MLFHTWKFCIFFVVTCLGFALFRRTRLKNLWLLIASYFFYGWWNPLYLVLIAYTTLLNYLVALRLEVLKVEVDSGPTNPGKFWLGLSIANNLFLLGFFKYAAFVTTNINLLLSSFGVEVGLPEPDILLPIGISFFTFQSMGYTIDVYRGKFDAEHNIITFATFVAFFPQLIAGPIERAKSLLPQLHSSAKITSDDIADGLSLFIVGLFKKIALADLLALYVDKIYNDPSNAGSMALIFATYAFAWQIYFDFSGYTDMARGLARAMGIGLSLNFNNPYTATDLRDFWRRWHITLSLWFRDYLYIPLGGNRKGTARFCISILLTMAIGGLWHGAAWKFIIWGLVHAVALVLFSALETKTSYHKLPRIIKQLLTFHIVSFAWIFFRADNIAEAWLIIQRIFTGATAAAQVPVLIFAMVAAVWIYQFIYESQARKILEAKFVRVTLMLIMLWYLMTFATSAQEPFIYFQF
ncbi:MAG: MBOAT family O-acyltransferase [Planctomycetota bacterium]|jgi:D-alanyl-lipoteichoic acid acyltransferase DltB (MBOAT superfamily)